MVRNVPRLPAGFSVPTSTVSPNHAYGVLVPDEGSEKDGVSQNQRIDLKTGRILGTIKAETGLVSMNHGGILPSHWSRDSSVLLWHVDGKWSPRALVLMKIGQGHIVWQTDVLRIVQREILTRTRQASPKKYHAAMHENAGNGSAFPDGFTVTVGADGESDAPLVLPLPIEADLTSNPKGIEEFPKTAQLDSSLKGVVTPDGKFHATHFKLGE